SDGRRRRQCSQPYRRNRVLTLWRVKWLLARAAWGTGLEVGPRGRENEKKAPAMSIHAAAIRTAPPPSPNRRLPLFPVAAAAIAMLLAAGALAGYALDIEF